MQTIKWRTRDSEARRFVRHRDTLVREPSDGLDDSLPQIHDPAVATRLSRQVGEVLPHIVAKTAQIAPEGSDPQELVNEALRMLLDGTRQWLPSDPLATLLMKIVTAVARRGIDPIEEVPLGEHALRDGLTPEQWLEQKQACEEILAHARELARRDPILTRIIEGACDGCSTADAIASAMGLPLDAVQAGNRRFRLRRDEEGCVA